MFHGFAFDKRVNTGPRCHSDFDSQKDRWWLLVRRQLYVYLFLFLEHCVKCIHLFLWIILFQFRSIVASPGLTIRSTFFFLRCFHGSNGLHDRLHRRRAPCLRASPREFSDLDPDCALLVERRSASANAAGVTLGCECEERPGSLQEPL